MKCPLLSLFLLLVLCTSVIAADKFVGPGGDNSNTGLSVGQRWAEFTYAVKNLEPGDTLTVLDGTYNIRDEVDNYEGTASIRRTGFVRLDGWTNRVTTIRAQNPGNVTINGNVNILGSFITLEGFRIIGDPFNIEPGIFVADSHHISILNNEIAYAGGGGINFNHSDTIRIVGNEVHHNCFRNPQQHSGISIYQPIKQVNPERRYWSIEIRRNICYQNLCLTPGILGQTDGNGIIVDDYRYTQNTFLKDYHRDMIGVRANYPGRTLIEANLCTFNGGCGIRLFQVLRVVVKNNTSVANNLLMYYDEDGEGGVFYNGGQILLGDSIMCHILNNVCQSHFQKDAPNGSPFAASEYFSYNNLWENNLYHSKVTWDGLWNNLPIGNKAFYWDPNFADEANYDYRANDGYGLGVRWDGHTYVDLNGKVVPPGGRVDLGAIQND